MSGVTLARREELLCLAYYEISRPGLTAFKKSQVRVGLGILTDLNWHLPSNVSIYTTHPLSGETRLVHYFYVSSFHPKISNVSHAFPRIEGAFF